jgi:hypothetical protein
MVALVKIQDDDYEIIDRGEENFHHIRLKAAPYADVVYQYGAVSLYEENDSLRVAFGYEVFENKNNVNTTSRAFIDYIGHILMNNLDELLIYNKYAKGKDVV